MSTSRQATSCTEIKQYSRVFHSGPTSSARRESRLRAAAARRSPRRGQSRRRRTMEAMVSNRDTSLLFFPPGETERSRPLPPHFQISTPCHLNLPRLAHLTTPRHSSLLRSAVVVRTVVVVRGVVVSAAAAAAEACRSRSRCLLIVSCSTVTKSCRLILADGLHELTAQNKFTIRSLLVPVNFPPLYCYKMIAAQPIRSIH